MAVFSWIRTAEVGFVQMIVEKLLLHVLIVLTPILIVHFFFDETKSKSSPVVLAALHIMAAMLCMGFSYQEFGLHWDLRYVPMVLAFLYGGPKAGWAVCIAIFIMRTFIGGEHLFIAYASITVSAIISYLFARYNKQINSKWKRVRFVIFVAFFPTIIKLGLTFLLLVDNKDLYSHYFETIYYVGIYAITLAIAMVFGALLLEEMNEKKKMKEEMYHSEKLNTIGELAASIAHEVRNPLTVVKGFFQLMEKEETGKKKDYYTISLGELHRAEEIISDYLNFAKPQFKHIEKVEISQLTREMIHFLTPYAIKGNVDLSLDRSVEAFVRTDRNQLKQALINLIKNAIEATPPKGKVTVSIQKNNEKIQVTIRDTGKGMTTEQLNRIGKLFYSTKEKGTGLGMMVSLRIIEEIGGSLTLTSEIGVGTVSVVILPSMQKEQQHI